MAVDSQSGSRVLTKSWRRVDAFALLALVGLAVALYHKLIFGGEALFARDVLPYVIPSRAYTSARLLGGAAPLWSPHTFCGMPFLADITNGVFDPVHLLFAPLPAHLAVSFSVVTYHVVAMTGAYVLVRRLGCGPAAALIAGASFGLSGYLVSMDDSVLYLGGVVWTPWVLWSVDRVCKRYSFPRVVLVAIFLACMCLTGEIQWTYLTALLAIAYAIRASGAGRRLRNTAWVALAGSIALAFLAFQLLPFAEVVLSSRRVGGLGGVEAMSWATHPLRFLELVAPTPFGAVGDNQSFWARGLVNDPHGIPWAQGTYLGVVTIVFCSVAWRQARARFFLVLAGLGMLLALGPYTPVAGFFQRVLPLWSSFRYPEKMIALVTFGLCIAAGLGAQEAFAKRRWRGPGVVVLLLGLTSIACVLFRSELLEAVTAHMDTHGVRHVDPSAATDRVVSALLWATAVGAAIVGLLVLRLRGRLTVKVGMAIAIALLASDLLVQDWAIQRTVPAGTFAQEPPLAGMTLPSEEGDVRGRVYRYELPFVISYEIDRSVLNAAHSEWQWHSLRTNMGVVSGVNYTMGYGVSMTVEFEEFWRRLAAHEDRAFILSATEYVVGVISANDYSNRSRYVPIADMEGQNIRLLRYLSAVSRIRLLYDVINEPADGVLDRLVGADFDPSRSVVVSDLPERRSQLAPSAVDIVDDTPEYISVRVTAEEDALLVVSDSWHSGWRARIDGEPTEILRANYLFRAIEVPVGEHVVELEFVPTSWRVGLAVTATTAVLVLSFLLFDVRRRRRESSP